MEKRVEQYKEQTEYEVKQREFQAWLHGYYVREAIVSAFNKKSKYPKNPLERREIVVSNMELTEEEKVEWSDKWLNKLLNMQKKFELNKKEGE